MRFLALSSLTSLAIVAAVSACSSGGTTNTIPNAPTLNVAPLGTQATPFQFNVSGVFIGTSGFANIVATNIGEMDLTVSTVTYTGDSAITLSPGLFLSTNPDVPATPPITVPYSDSLVVALTCTPVQHTPEVAETYNGVVEIKSNASNTPDVSAYFQCMGVVFDAGT